MPRIAVRLSSSLPFVPPLPLAVGIWLFDTRILSAWRALPFELVIRIHVGDWCGVSWTDWEGRSSESSDVNTLFPVDCLCLWRS